MYHLYNALLGGLKKYRFFEWDSLELGGPLMTWVYLIVFFASLMLVVSVAGLVLLLGSCCHPAATHTLCSVCLFPTFTPPQTSTDIHRHPQPNFTVEIKAPETSRNRLKVHPGPVGLPWFCRLRMLMTCGAACRCRRSEPAVAFIESPQAGTDREPLDSVVGRSLAFIEIEIPAEESLGMLEHHCQILS